MIDDKTIRVDVDLFGEVSEGFVVVTKNGKNALIDLSGRIVLDYNAPYTPSGKSFKDGWLSVQDVVIKKFGFIDTTLKLVVPCILSASDFNKHGLRYDYSQKPPQRILTRVGGTINLSMPDMTKLKLPVHPMADLGFAYAKPTGEGYLKLFTNHFLAGENLARFDVRFSEVRPAAANAKPSKYADSWFSGFYDISGRIVIQPTFNMESSYNEMESLNPRTFYHGCIWVRQRMADDSHRWLLIDTLGNKVGDLTFRNTPTRFEGGFSVVVSEDESVGIVDLKGRIVHEFKKTPADYKNPNYAGVDLYKLKHVDYGDKYVLERRFLSNPGPWRVIEKFTYEGKDVFWCENRFTTEAVQRMLQPPIGTCLQPSTAKAAFHHSLNDIITGNIDAPFQGMRTTTGGGVIDANANWVVPPVFPSELSNYAAEEQLIYVEVDYFETTPGMDGKKGKLQGYVDHCGKYRLLKAEKSKW